MTEQEIAEKFEMIHKFMDRLRAQGETLLLLQISQNASGLARETLEKETED